MRKHLTAYFPGASFPAISVTGGSCELQCDHCRGFYLRSMIDASEKGSITAIGDRLKREGAVGALVSGGCDMHGRVPLSDRLDEIRYLKRLGLIVNVHPGLVTDEEASSLAGTGADRFSLDMHHSEHVISGVLHLDGGPARFMKNVETMCRYAPGKVVPHLCAGLDGNIIDNEKHAIDLLRHRPLASFVMLRHLPCGAALLHPEPPLSDDNFLHLVEYAIDKLDVPIMLGCMRPRGSSDLEVRCAELGVAGIAVPMRETVLRLKTNGYDIEEVHACCAHL